MNAETQRIAIAEACGLHPHKSWDGPVDGAGYSLPDYLNDLNAIHVAEKTLKDAEARWSYIRKLKEVCAKPDSDFIAKTEEVISATAEQRSEAFLKTLGLWKP
jgi:hypothetical protein